MCGFYISFDNSLFSCQWYHRSFPSGKPWMSLVLQIVNLQLVGKADTTVKEKKHLSWHIVGTRMEVPNTEVLTAKVFSTQRLAGSWGLLTWW